MSHITSKHNDRGYEPSGAAASTSEKGNIIQQTKIVLSDYGCPLDKTSQPTNHPCKPPPDTKTGVSTPTTTKCFSQMFSTTPVYTAGMLSFDNKGYL